MKIEAKDKIFNDLNGLHMLSNISIDTEKNENVFDSFFKNFICLLPENFLLLDFQMKKILSDDFELEEDLVKFFISKCREHKEIEEKKRDRKRLYSEVEKVSQSLCPSNGESLSLIGNSYSSNLSFSAKKKKTVEDYFPKTNKDLGFRGVKEIINNSGKNILTSYNSLETSALNSNSQQNTSFEKFNKMLTKSNSHTLLVDSINTLKDLPSCFSEKSVINSDNQSDIVDDHAISELHDQEHSDQIDINSNTINTVISGFQKLKTLSTSSNVTNCYNKSTNFSNVSSMLSNAQTSQFEYFAPNKQTNINSSNLNPISNSNCNSNHIQSASMSNLGISSNLSQSGENSNSLSLTVSLNRSLSMPRGINSRLAGNSIQMFAHAKKQKNPSVRKKGNLRLVDQMLEKINKASESKRKTSADLMRSQGTGLNGTNGSNALDQLMNMTEEKIENKNNLTSGYSSVNENHVKENPFKKLVNKKFYAKEKELKTPSPIKSIFTKYSKKKLEDINPNQGQETNCKEIRQDGKHNSSSNFSSENMKSFNTHSYCAPEKSYNNKLKIPLISNLNSTPTANKPLNQKFMVLKNRDNNPLQSSNTTLKNKLFITNNQNKKENIKKDTDIREIYGFCSLKYDVSESNNEIMVFNKLNNITDFPQNENIIKKQNDLSNEISSELNNFNSLSLSFNKNSTSKSVISEDDVLVYSTPTKVGENFKFGRRSPNASSRMNLMNLFKQIKGEK